MIDFSTINKIVIFLIDLIGFSLAIWVYLANKRARINQTFALFVISILAWITFSYLLNSPGLTSNLAILIVKLGYVSAFLFFIAVYFFVTFFPREEKRHRFIDRVILILMTSLIPISIFTDLLVKDVEFTQWGVSPVLGPGGIPISATIFAVTLLILVMLIRKYFRLREGERLKIQYFLIGFLIFFITNLITNVILAPRWTTFPYYYFGNYSAVFLIAFTGYAIIQRELFGIRVILTQALVGVIAILLLWQSLIAIPEWLEFSWKFILFLLFLVFGYFLIQSVIREIQRRAELQRLYDELEKLDEAKTEFMSIVSHQLRTPLTAIKGYTSMMLEGIYGKINEKMKKPLANSLFSSERLIKFVNDILNVTRIETGRLEFNPKQTSIEEIVSSVIFELDIKAKEKNLQLKWEKPKQPLPKVLIDPDKIRQVIINLIDNAIKYTNKGWVKADCEVKGNKYLISISDSGTGMSKEEILKLFKSFSRGESGVVYYKEGTGLGLYIGRQFIEKQGGRVWAESLGKGKGSTFYIELPMK